MNKKLGLAALGLAGAFAVGYVVKQVVNAIKGNLNNNADETEECNYEIIPADENASSDVDSDEE